MNVHQASSGRHRFDEMVIGIGSNGAKKDINGNLTLGACRELNACRLFRDRMYRAYKLEPPPAVSARPGDAPFRAILIENKRYPKTMLESLVSAFHADKSLKNGMTLELISWSPNVTHLSMQNGDLTEHLKVIRSTDVHISGPGTGQMYQTLLPDGAVHINLGAPAGCPRGYMEEYMAEGAPYLRALYYTNPGGLIDPGMFLSVVRQAKEILTRGLSMPVPIGTNLSPVGQVYKAYVWMLFKGTAEEKAVAELAPIRLVPRAPTLGNNFFENVVCRGLKGPGKPNDKPALNDCLMGALRESFDMRYPSLGRHGAGWFGTGGKTGSRVLQRL